MYRMTEKSWLKTRSVNNKKNRKREREKERMKT